MTRINLQWSPPPLRGHGFLFLCHARIESSPRVGVSNAFVDAKSTHPRLFAHIAPGFRRLESLIGLAKLELGRPSPSLPGRLCRQRLSREREVLGGGTLWRKPVIRASMCYSFSSIHPKEGVRNEH